MEKAYTCKRCGTSIVINEAERKGRCHSCGTEYLLSNQNAAVVTQTTTTVIKNIYGNVYGTDNEKLFDNADKLIDAGQADNAKAVIDKLLREETTDYRTWLLLIKLELSFFDSKKNEPEFSLLISQYIESLKMYLNGNSIGDYLIFKSLTEREMNGFTCCYIGCKETIDLPNFGFEKLVKFCTSENLGRYDLKIEQGLSVIGKYAFSDCKNVATITIPESVQHIDFKAFENCENLFRIKFSFTSNVLNDENSAALRELLWDKNKLGAKSLIVIIMRDISKIETGVFINLKAITHISCKRGNTLLQTSNLMIVFSEKLKTICSFAFSGCSNLKSAELSPTIEHIGEGAFTNCKKISKIEITATNVMLEDSVFEGFTKLQKITMYSSNKQTTLWGKKWKHNCKAQIIFTKKA